MQYLNESKIIDSTIDLQQAFSENGYLFIRSFFPRELIVDIRKHIFNVLEFEKWGNWEEDLFIAREPAHRINSPAFYQCISSLMEIELLHELSQHSSLYSLLGRLLGETVYSHPRKMVRITYPYEMNPKDCIPPHQDLVYVKGELDTFTTWIPFGDYPPELGGVEVASKSHQGGLYPIQENAQGRFGCTAIEENVRNFSWCEAHYKPGDLLVMHSLTLHRSGINKSKQFRLSLDCRFSSSLRTINEDQLLPPYYPHVPAWSILSEKWKNSNRFEVPPTLQIHEKNKDLEEIISTSSRFVK